jgi:hypothetical protein
MFCLFCSLFSAQRIHRLSLMRDEHQQEQDVQPIASIILEFLSISFYFVIEQGALAQSKHVHKVDELLFS